MSGGVGGVGKLFLQLSENCFVRRWCTAFPGSDEQNRIEELIFETRSR